MDSPADRFWASYLQSLPQAASDKKHYYEAFHFGNDERLANVCANLVMSGIKTATSSLLWEHEATGKPLPRVGDLSIVTDWNSDPVCIIETVELRIVPFNEVDERFVRDYGEGDRSMGWWHKDMWDYYAVQCASLGRPLTPGMPLVCERFRVVFPEKR